MMIKYIVLRQAVINIEIKRFRLKKKPGERHFQERADRVFIAGGSGGKLSARTVHGPSKTFVNRERERRVIQLNLTAYRMVVVVLIGKTLKPLDIGSIGTCQKMLPAAKRQFRGRAG